MNKRSTLDAVLLLRRAIELVEEKPTNSLHLLFVDWEKAFDRVHPEAVAAVLRRYNAPEHLVRVIGALLAAPAFRVSMDSEQSDWK
eukprot:3400092-Alexandrium_andersonii.AAC.1